MKKITLLIILITFYNCKHKKIGELNNANFYGKRIFEKELNDSLFDYKLSYIKKDSLGDLTLKKIIIKSKIKQNIIQEIKLDSTEIDEDDLFFSVSEDVNFDGQNDICLINYNGAYSSTFLYWIYNKKTNQFIHNKALDDIQNPVILNKKKQICSFWHSGVSEFHLEKYFWKNDSLILKEKYEETWTNKGHLETTKLINNKYVKKDSIIDKNIVMFMKCK